MSSYNWSARALTACFLLILCAGTCFSQEPAQLDGPKHIFNDPLLDNMAGSWKMTGKVRGQSAEHSVEADWILNHQFLRIHEKDGSPAKAYEALIMIGYDNASERYVAHWNDVYGGRFSETLGYGTRADNEIRFVFEYPDGPFHTTFRWKPDTKQWEWLMETKNESGRWTEFADLTLTRKEDR